MELWTQWYERDGIWNGDKVIVIPYAWNAPTRKDDLLAMLALNASQKEGRISCFAPKLLLLGRQANGIVLLGLPKGEKVWRTIWLTTFFSRLKRAELWVFIIFLLIFNYFLAVPLWTLVCAFTTSTNLPDKNRN